MSSTATTPADSKKVRNRILIAVGTVIIVATYLYLVVGQPTDIAENTFSQAGLIAIAGYVIGAVLLAMGAIHRLPTATVAMVPVAIALNIVVGQLVSVLGLPIYLDSIGTVLVSALAGPAAGVVTGILTNVIWGLTLSPIALPYAVVQVIIGVMAGYAARLGMFRLFYLAPVAGAITGLVAAVVSAPISAFVFGGATGGGTGAIVGAFQAMGQSLLGATTLQGLLSDPLDKAITFTVVVIILAALPSRFRQRFPFVRQYNVFGRKAPVLPTQPAAAAPSPAAPAPEGADSARES
ncbi:MAG TPA: ECF transporter S component [Terrimesophilobacter sp.]|uniref:ECF transporter S component n=1 Tax=Terrimesophilobacter sp. TaxID=2906435 RepID=UPI002F92E281